jgi:peptidyl-prolyl cis-trans isomerase SurA
MTKKHIRLTFAGQHATRDLTRYAGRALALLAVTAAAAGCPAAFGQAKTNYPAANQFPTAPQLQLPVLPTPPAITPNGSVVEDVIARVNDQIITRSEYERSEQQLLQEAEQTNMSEAELQDHLHTLLRDMIDQQLLLSKGKELGITGDAETIRQLDEIRKQNHLDSMEALQKAAEQQGVSYEDFKQRIRNQVITQQVVREEVGRRLNMTHAEEEAYYNAHTKDFEVPEQVHLSEILVPTAENATDADIAAAQAKADELAAKLKAGANFADLAKVSSGGPTASAGGDLGDFKRGTLGDVLEKATFSLPVGGVTAPIRTRQGFVILRVDSHQAAGVAPLADVEPQVEEAIYVAQMQPALRAYLTKARQDAYVEIAAGFVDAGSAKKPAKPDIAYTAYAAPAVKKHVEVKQRVEQEKAAKAQQELAAARERVAEKQAAKAAAAAQPGVKTASAKVKPPKIHREKIRYGQAPRKSLPAAPAGTVETASSGAPLTGQAPGVAMAPTDSVTSITTGVGADGENDPFAPKAGPQHKTRYSDHENQAEEAQAKAKLAKAEEKATTRPVPPTHTESATEKVQGAPLGLNGDTEKKPKKPKHEKGEPKQRLQEQQKPAETVTPVAPTVNPALATPAVAPAPAATPQ